MDNTTRDRTEERRDRDDPGRQVMPPPKKPAADATGHVPGDATGMAEQGRALQDETDLKK